MQLISASSLTICCSLLVVRALGGNMLHSFCLCAMEAPAIGNKQQYCEESKYAQSTCVVALFLRCRGLLCVVQGCALVVAASSEPRCMFGHLFANVAVGRFPGHLVWWSAVPQCRPRLQERLPPHSPCLLFPAVADKLIEKEDLVSLDRGCICCCLRKDILRALAEIERRARVRGKRFDAVILETTGLADPAPVAFTFLANPWIASRFKLDSILCVVDARYLLQVRVAALGWQLFSCFRCLTRGYGSGSSKFWAAVSGPFGESIRGRSCCLSRLLYLACAKCGVLTGLSVLSSLRPQPLR